jgi:hypothetical protein
MVICRVASLADTDVSATQSSSQLTIFDLIQLQTVIINTT